MVTADYHLGVIGSGNMAEAIMRGVLREGFLSGGQIVASEPLPDRREYIDRKVGVRCVEDNRLPAACPRVLLAVKPQLIGKVLGEIAETVAPDATVISIAAGIATSVLDERLGGRGRIVRVMPNTPMLVGCGMSALCAGPRATKDDLEWCEQLFAASGKVVVVEERLMDAVTAVSGSGPAYFFYLLEAMVAAGTAEGLPPETALLLAGQTCRGAAELLLRTNEPPEVLRARVTSPGGTTEQAVKILDSAAVKEKLIQAVRAAAERSRQLGH